MKIAQFYVQLIAHIIISETRNTIKAMVNVTFGQEIDLQVWDWDPGFPGVQNDDPLGRCGLNERERNLFKFRLSNCSVPFLFSASSHCALRSPNPNICTISTHTRPKTYLRCCSCLDLTTDFLFAPGPIFSSVSAVLCRVCRARFVRARRLSLMCASKRWSD